MTEQHPAQNVRSGARIGRHMALVAGANFAVPVSAALTAPVLAQGLGVVGRGEVSAAIAPLMLMTSAANFGIPASILYYTALRPLTAWHNIRLGLKVGFAGGILAGLLMVVLSGWLSDGSSQVQQAIVGLAVIVPLTLYGGAFRGAASGLNRWGLVALEKGSNGLARLVSVYALWFLDQMTVLNVALCIALPGLISCVVYLPLIRVPRSEVDEAVGAGELSRYGVKVWGGSVSGILLHRMDQAIMAPLAGVTQLGYYTVAINVSDVAVLANNAMRQVTVASDAADNDNRRLFLTARMSMLIATAMAIVIGGTIWFWFDALFGVEFHPAVHLVLVLLVASVCGTPGSVAGAGLSARGHPGLRSWSLAVGLVVNLIALVALAPWWGAMGAACATFLGSQTASQLNIVWFQRRFGGSWSDFYGVRAHDIRRLGRAVGGLARR